MNRRLDRSGTGSTSIALNLTEYNRRYDNKKPTKRRSGWWRALPVAIVLVIGLGYVPMIMLLVRHKEGGSNDVEVRLGQKNLDFAVRVCLR